MKFKKNGATEHKIYSIVKPITDELGYFLWDISFTKEGAQWYLRIFIDRDEGISIADCEAVTRPVSDALDEADPISQSYILEVGSAGLERELNREEHFEVCMGDEVRVRFIRPIDGEKETVGILTGYDKENINIDEKALALADIAFVKLYFDI